MGKEYSEQFLVKLIDDLGPLNNKFRLTNEPLEKIGWMWEIGKRIDQALIESNSKLHELLYTLYDPHGKKIAYITRDLGSYGYRIYKYFGSKDDIKKTLPHLKHYTLFREAIPLLFNDKYKLSEKEKSQIITLIQNSGNPAVTTKKIKQLKQSIQPRKNPRDQRSSQYQKEAAWLANLKIEVTQIFKEHEDLPTSDLPLNKSDRSALVKILMGLASESTNQVDGVHESMLSNNDVKLLLQIAGQNNQDKARFRKWAMDTYSLMSLAESIRALDSPETYRFVRRKLANKD